MFEKIQQYPLFQGLSFRDISEIIEWMKLDFNQHSSGDTIVIQSEKCNSIIFILNGTVCAEYMDEENRFTLTEYLNTPHVLEPYNIYGMYQRYNRTYWMQTDGSSLVIPKSVFNELIRRYQIIRTNYMNMICSRLQKCNHNLGKMGNNDIRAKIATVIRNSSSICKGHKFIKIKMETLANIIGETRLNVSRELNKMNKEQLINIKRGEIEVFELSKL